VRARRSPTGASLARKAVANKISSQADADFESPVPAVSPQSLGSGDNPALKSGGSGRKGPKGLGVGLKKGSTGAGGRH